MISQPLKYNVAVTYFREGQRFVAYSPALDLSTSGRTFDEVKRRFNEAAEIFFEEIVKRGTLREVLSKNVCSL